MLNNFWLGWFEGKGKVKESEQKKMECKAGFRNVCTLFMAASVCRR